eukprot:CAMPEP_0194664492 /NCGR_PEP_ID=MMETSP0295-20121207/1498_1 /TAXON_ID=39354 /ORGANISM="Heterosigma akashiwo, Strain CCMP2393" /LENGTH=165 /DNA_ID=CAMNT_0039546253 /DNA_START=661 /DNA_END=1156 /DNA_ORIENTATION=+
MYGRLSVSTSHFLQTPKTDSFKSMVSSVSGMKVTVYPATEVSETFVPQFQANFKLEGADNPGLVYAVTNYLAKFGIWVDDIHTETASAPFGGTQLFVMTGKATSDQPVDAAALRAGFRELENELNVDLSSPAPRAAEAWARAAGQPGHTAFWREECVVQRVRLAW